MVHRESNDLSKNITWNLVGDFEVNKCRGIYRFFKLDRLVSAGFLDVDEDELILQYQVRPPTFYQQCKDLKWY